MRKVEERVVVPTIEGLKKEGIPYRGFIFIGLMNVGGEPYVIEYNVRMGDPETQAVVPRIQSDFGALLLAAATGRLADATLKVDDEFAATVVMVAGGYPNEYKKGHRISGLDNEHDALVFHAGSALRNSDVVTNGGRVLAITGRDGSLDGALRKAYDVAAQIKWEGVYFRRDIGKDLLKLA